MILPGILLLLRRRGRRPSSSSSFPSDYFYWAGLLPFFSSTPFCIAFTPPTISISRSTSRNILARRQRQRQSHFGQSQFETPTQLQWLSTATTTTTTNASYIHMASSSVDLSSSKNDDGVLGPELDDSDSPLAVSSTSLLRNASSSRKRSREAKNSLSKDWSSRTVMEIPKIRLFPRCRFLPLRKIQQQWVSVFQSSQEESRYRCCSTSSRSFPSWEQQQNRH